VWVRNTPNPGERGDPRGAVRKGGSAYDRKKKLGPGVELTRTNNILQKNPTKKKETVELQEACVPIWKKGGQTHFCVGVEA